MRSRALFAGVFSGLAGTLLLLFYLRRVEETAAGGHKVSVLVAHQDIARGKPITEAMLGTRDVPMAYVDDRVVRAADKDKILNLVATNTVPVQQSLAWTDVITMKDEQRALSSLVQPGNRATPLRVQISEVLALIHPGDFVDVVCVCGESKDASVLLQRVLVLATGMETRGGSDGKDDRSRQATILTVSVSLQESQLLAVAMEKGKLSVLVRNTNDARVVDSPQDLPAAALTEAGRQKVLPSPRRRAQSGPIELKDTRK